MNAGRFDVNPLELDFGVVQVGQSLTKSFTLSNGGGQRLTVTRSKPPATGVGFTGGPLPEGTSLAPGESLTVTVTFAPTANGDVTDQWALNADADQGAQTVTLRGTGAEARAARTLGPGATQGRGEGLLRALTAGARPPRVPCSGRSCSSWGGCSGLAPPLVEAPGWDSASSGARWRNPLAGSSRNHGTKLLRRRRVRRGMTSRRAWMLMASMALTFSGCVVHEREVVRAPAPACAGGVWVAGHYGRRGPGTRRTGVARAWWRSGSSSARDGGGLSRAQRPSYAAFSFAMSSFTICTSRSPPASRGTRPCRPSSRP